MPLNYLFSSRYDMTLFYYINEKFIFPSFYSLTTSQQAKAKEKKKKSINGSAYYIFNTKRSHFVSMKKYSKARRKKEFMFIILST